MKQNDIAMLILVVSISLVSSILIFNALIPDARSEATVEVVNVIDSEFPNPDPDVFKSGFLNPTELIRIEASNTKQVFDESSE